MTLLSVRNRIETEASRFFDLRRVAFSEDNMEYRTVWGSSILVIQSGDLFGCFADDRFITEVESDMLYGAFLISVLYSKVRESGCKYVELENMPELMHSLLIQLTDSLSIAYVCLFANISENEIHILVPGGFFKLLLSNGILFFYEGDKELGRWGSFEFGKISLVCEKVYEYFGACDKVVKWF